MTSGGPWVSFSGADRVLNCPVANGLAAGEPSRALRSYLKKLADETWEYVNWLTHAKSAVRLDA